MKRLEYIQSTREQRIDTGLKLDNTCEIEMRIAQLQSTGFLYWLRLIGSNGQMEIICQQGTDNSISVNWGGNSWSNLKTVEYEVPYTLKLNADGFFVDGEQVYVNTNKPTFSTNNITIFSYPTDAGFEMNRMRLYELTIRRGGVEIAHFLPYLDDNGVPCIYDTINEVFKYDTIGTTPFEYLQYQSLSVEPEQIEFGYKGGTQQINIVSRGEYTYTTDGDFEFTENEDGILVTAQFNNGDADKAGSVVFTSEDGEVVNVSINQKHMLIPFVIDKYKHADYNIYKEYRNNSVVKKVMRNDALVYVNITKKPTLIVNVDTLKFNNVGGTENITITTDAKLTFSSDVDWLTFEPIADGVNVTASESDVDERNGTITITADNGDFKLTKTISVSQIAAIFPFDFLCNYNAKDYVNRTIPKTEGQLFDNDLVFNGDLTHNGEYVTLGNSHYVEFGFPSYLKNPFNRYNQNGERELTIIYKTNRFTGSSQNIFANRGGEYNYMVRGNFFHTSDSAFLQFNTSASPNITYVRVAADGKAERKSISGDISATGTCLYGGPSYGVAFFRGGFEFASEYFNADFYWIFITDKYLNDAEIQKVIDYNENKITPQPNNEI